MNWLENGVANVDWWDLHNSIMTGTNDSPSLYGTADYGDYGVLSSGESSNGVSEPPADTPFPTYYGLQILHKFADAGDRMLGASSNQSLIAVHAVKRADGSIAVLFINKDPNTTYAVTLSWTGFKPAPNLVAYFYGENSTSISRIREPGIVPDYLQVLPPYSLTALIVPPASQ